MGDLEQHLRDEIDRLEQEIEELRGTQSRITQEEVERHRILWHIAGKRS